MEVAYGGSLDLRDMEGECLMQGKGKKIVKKIRWIDPQLIDFARPEGSGICNYGSGAGAGANLCVGGNSIGDGTCNNTGVGALKSPDCNDGGTAVPTCRVGITPTGFCTDGTGII